MAGGDVNNLIAAIKAGTALAGFGQGGGNPFSIGVANKNSPNPSLTHITVVPSTDPNHPGFFVVELQWSKYGGNVPYGKPANKSGGNGSMLTWSGTFVSPSTSSSVTINNQFQSGSATGSTINVGANPMIDIPTWSMYGSYNSANQSFASYQSNFLYHINSNYPQAWGKGINSAQMAALSTAVVQMAPWATANGF